MKILLQLKNKLLREALKNYLSLHNQYSISCERKEKNYDVIIFDKVSLKETSPKDFEKSKKLLIDDGLTDEEAISLFLYYELSGIIACYTNLELILKCFKVVCKGEMWLENRFIQKLRDINIDLISSPKKFFISLSEKEREVIKLVIEGKSNKEIAQILGISESTVKSHLNRIYKKTGLKFIKRLD